jgi:hypothetical protein
VAQTRRGKRRDKNPAEIMKRAAMLPSFFFSGLFDLQSVSANVIGSSAVSGIESLTRCVTEGSLNI